MALNFEHVYQDADFFPEPDEIQMYEAIMSSPKRKKVRHQDEYDNLGRNISEQERRQNKVPWVKVRRIYGKLYIDSEKKNILRSMRLI